MLCKLGIDRDCVYINIILLLLYLLYYSFIRDLLNLLNKLKQLRYLIQRHKQIILVDDGNINILENTVDTRTLNTILAPYGTQYLVDFPTRVTNSLATCLDNCFTNIHKHKIKVSGLITKLYLHFPVYLHIQN